MFYEKLGYISSSLHFKSMEHDSLLILCRRRSVPLESRAIDNYFHGTGSGRPSCDAISVAGEARRKTGAGGISTGKICIYTQLHRVRASQCICRTMNTVLLIARIGRSSYLTPIAYSSSRDATMWVWSVVEARLNLEYGRAISSVMQSAYG
jgi:hypothetical protein